MVGETVDPKKRLGIAPWWFYGAVLVTSVVFSVLGFLYGALHDPAADGGRGGALAVVVAFFALFAKSNFALQSFKDYAVELPHIHHDIRDALSALKGERILPTAAPSPIDAALDRINGILGMLRANSRIQFVQNIFVALAAAIGTLSWGFGDWGAEYVQHHWLGCLCGHGFFLCKMLRAMYPAR